MMHRIAVAALVLFLAVPALPALAAWPAEVVVANRALATAASYRVSTTQGTVTSSADLRGKDRDRLTLPGNAYVVREADDSDGVSAAHLYHVIYPGGAPQIRWYIRVSDGLVHRIREPGNGGALTITIDHYRGVPAAQAR
jgi:hypothetical protein